MTDAPVIARTNLLGLERSGMESFVQELGHQNLPRAPAVELDVQARGRHQFDQMTDLAKVFRAQLARARGNPRSGNRHLPGIR